MDMYATEMKTDHLKRYDIDTYPSSRRGGVPPPRAEGGRIREANKDFTSESTMI
jgi:hypothetical protein